MSSREFEGYGGRHVSEALEGPLSELSEDYDGIEKARDETVLVNLSGRGDKDMETTAERFSL